MTGEVWTVYFNPRCSKCRALVAELDAAGIRFRLRRYLEDPPARAELEGLLGKLDSDDPMVIVRRKEALFRDLGLEGAGRDTLLDALVQHPRLLERPIVETPARALVCRPPERWRELVSAG